MRWLLALVGCVGCYAPHPQSGAPCPDGVCPEGLICSPATTTCELRAGDAAVPIIDDADLIIDGPRGDGPMSDAAAPTIPMLIQQATNYAEVATSLSATLPATPAAGRMLIMIGANVSGALATVSGGAAIWTMAARSLINSNVEIWFGVSNGLSATVTIARAEASAMWIAVSEWSGLATTTTLDAATADFGSANPVTAGSITTTNARDLLVFAATTGSPNTYGSPTPGTWTTMPGIVGATHMQGEWYRIVTATGTYDPQVTQSGSATWEAAVVALRIAP